MSISLRRHHQARYDVKARAISRTFGADHDWHRLRHNRAPCSCPMCGNPRKFFNQLTIQEKRYGQTEPSGQERKYYQASYA